MSQLADRHIELNAVLRGNTVGALTRIWRALPDHRDASLETWLQSVPALISAARRQQITITSTYLSRALDRPVDGADADAIMAGYRNGTPLETVYKRPFEVVWRSVGAGTPYPAAAEQGLARATQTAAADVQMAMRDTLTSVGQAEDSIWGYQRVADGGACEFCLLLDGAQFKTDDPMPIHNFCGCGVEPVVYTRGWANRNNLAKFNSSLQKTPKGVDVNTHGERGPVIGTPDHAITTA